MADFDMPSIAPDRLDAILVVRVSASERDAVRRIAARNRVTMSEMIRRMIAGYIGETDGRSGDLAHAKRVLGISGRMRRIEKSLLEAPVRVRVRK